MVLKKERVEEILKNSDALMEGHFLLNSGKHSNRYIQCAQTLQHPWFTHEIAEGLAEAFVDDQIEIALAPATGGMIISYDIARQLKAKNLFSERKEKRMVLRRGFSIPKGARVLLVEDFISTGGTIFEVIDLVQSYGGNVIGVAAFVNKSQEPINFGVKTIVAYNAKMEIYEANDCPLCKEARIPLETPSDRS